jgi:hypothetical protein
MFLLGLGPLLPMLLRWCKVAIGANFVKRPTFECASGKFTRLQYYEVRRLGEARVLHALSSTL